MTSKLSNRIGVAFIVSIDYSTQQAHRCGLKVLNGTHRDAEKMSEAFNKLRYEVVPRRNLTLPNLIDFVGKAAAWQCHPSYKRLVFVFAGHGNCNGVIYSQEGGVANVEDIIDQFKPDKNPHLGKMARLFFFDACRGANVDHGVELTARSGSRGGGFLSPERVPTHGNILVAYSTLPFHESFELHSGGVWMSLLAEAIQSQDDDITVILTDVNSRLTEMCKTHQLFQNPQKFQTPQCINQLLEHVNFLAESSQIGRSTVQLPSKVVLSAPRPAHTPPVLPPVHRSQSSSTPVSKLQEFCQQNELSFPEYKESPTKKGDSGFRYTVTVNSRTYVGAVKPRKQEAKQSAAEVANKQVASSKSGMATSNQLKVANGETPKLGAIPRDRARSFAPKFGRCYHPLCAVIIASLLALCLGMYFGHSHSSGACVKTASPTQLDKSVGKTPVSVLLEHCQQNKLKSPEYIEMPVQNGSGFSYIVTVKGNSYNGTVKANKQEAKHSAAEVALQQLGLDHAEPSSSSVSYISELKKKYFDKNHIPFKKEYFVTKKISDGGFQCTLTIPEVCAFISEISLNKSGAENSAAKVALEYLNLL